MKRTIVWPPKVRAGRLAMTEDPELDPLDPAAALRQVIRLNLLDGTSTNPWNSGIGTPDQTFKPATPTTKARLRSRVNQVFAKLERTHRAKLAGLTFDPNDPDNPGRLIMRLVYLDLENGGRANMEITRG